MNRHDLAELTDWLQEVSDTAGAWADGLDPDRTGTATTLHELLPALDALMRTACRAHGIAESYRRTPSDVGV